MALYEENAAAATVAGGATFLLDEIMSQTRMLPGNDGYDVAKQGVAAFISSILDTGTNEEPINKLLVDKMIIELDKKLSVQMDEILHAEKFREIESSWRSLKLLVDRTDFRENIKINIIHATKAELLEDFEFSPEIIQSGFYKHVYSAGYGQFGGEPTAAIIGNYAFSNNTPDMKLLQYVSAVGAMAHSPFLSSVAPDFFGISSFTELPAIKDLKSVFEGPAHTKWRALRESEDSRYLGLTTPRFLLRLPYSTVENPIKNFNYYEDVSKNHEHFLWGNTAYLLASCLTDSFAKYRWCQSAVELGVIDLNDATATTSDFRKSIELAIKNCIERYEPRISNVVVQSLLDQGDPLLLSFHISARVNFDNIGDAIEFNIQLDSNRRYCLNREA